MEGIAMETGQSISDSNLQEIMQSSALSVGVDVNSGISKLYCMLQYLNNTYNYFCLSCYQTYCHSDEKKNDFLF